MVCANVSRRCRCWCKSRRSRMSRVRTPHIWLTIIAFFNTQRHSNVEATSPGGVNGRWCPWWKIAVNVHKVNIVTVSCLHPVFFKLGPSNLAQPTPPTITRWLLIGSWSNTTTLVWNVLEGQPNASAGEDITASCYHNGQVWFVPGTKDELNDCDLSDTATLDWRMRLTMHHADHKRFFPFDVSIYACTGL